MTRRVARWGPSRTAAQKALPDELAREGRGQGGAGRTVVRLSALVVRCLIEGGEVGADVVDVGDAEVGVGGQGLAPVVAGPVEIAAGLVGVGKSIVRAGLLVPGSDLAGQGEGCGVMSAGLIGLTNAKQGLPNAVESVCLTVWVVHLAE